MVKNLDSIITLQKDKPQLPVDACVHYAAFTDAFTVYTSPRFVQLSNCGLECRFSEPGLSALAVVLALTTVK